MPNLGYSDEEAARTLDAIKKAIDEGYQLRPKNGIKGVAWRIADLLNIPGQARCSHIRFTKRLIDYDVTRRCPFILEKPSEATSGRGDYYFARQRLR